MNTTDTKHNEPALVGRFADGAWIGLVILVLAVIALIPTVIATYQFVMGGE